MPDAAPADRVRAVERAGGSPVSLYALSRCATADGASASGAIAGLVWSELGRLDADGRRILRAASLIGGGFSAELLAAVLGGETQGGDLLDRLRHLVSRGFLRTRSASLFEFPDALTRAACHDLLTESDLRSGNRALADALAARGAPPARVASIAAAHNPGVTATELGQLVARRNDERLAGEQYRSAAFDYERVCAARGEQRHTHFSGVCTCGCS
jgi:hypothetical protein